jgi:hypothetical protein
VDLSNPSCNATNTLEAPATAPLLSEAFEPADSSEGSKEPPQKQNSLMDLANLSVSKIVDVSVSKMRNDKVDFDGVQTTPSEAKTKLNLNAESIDCDTLVRKSDLLDVSSVGSNTENFNSFACVGNHILENALETTGLFDMGTGVQNPKADHFNEVDGYDAVNENSSQTLCSDGDESFSLVTDCTITGSTENISNDNEHFDLVEGELHI